MHTASSLLIVIGHIKELAASYLVKTIPLARILVQHFIDQFSKLVGVRNSLEYFPVRLLLA